MNFVTALSVIKKYWWVGAILASIVYAQIRISNAQKVLEIANSSHQEQISALKHFHEEEIAKRDALIVEYKKKNKQIEKMYKKRLARLKKQRQKKVKQVLEDFKSNPEKLKADIIEKYRFEYVFPKNRFPNH